jgi:hypothetical protein
LCAWEERNAHNVLFGKPEGEIPLSRPGHRCRLILKYMDIKV